MIRLWLRDSRRRYLLARGSFALLLALTVAIPVFAAVSGWRAQSMSTPSMGRVAPVGSLVITRPVPASRSSRG